MRIIVLPKRIDGVDDVKISTRLPRTAIVLVLDDNGRTAQFLVLRVDVIYTVDGYHDRTWLIFSGAVNVRSARTQTYKYAHTRKEEDEIFHAMFSGNGCRCRDGSGRVNPWTLQLSIQRSEKGRSEQLHGKNRGGNGQAFVGGVVSRAGAMRMAEARTRPKGKKTLRERDAVCSR